MGVLEDIRADQRRRREEYARGFHWPKYPPRLRFEEYTNREIREAWDLIHALGYFCSSTGRWARMRDKFFAICMWEDRTGGHALPARSSREAGEG